MKLPATPTGQFKVPRQNHNCGSINSVSQEGKWVDHKCSKWMSRQTYNSSRCKDTLHDLPWFSRAEFYWAVISMIMCCSPFEYSSGLLSVKDSLCLECPWWAGRHKWLLMSGFSSAEAWLICHWDQKKRARKAKQRNLISGLLLISPHGEKILTYFPFSVSTLYMLKSIMQLTLTLY